MMIRLSGGWVSVEHVQHIVPKGNGNSGCTVWMIDNHFDANEDADVVAELVNEVRAALVTLAGYTSTERENMADENEGIDLIRSIVRRQEAADNGEEESEN